MDAALGLADAGQDAVEILAGLLHVFDAAFPDQRFAGLEDVAGLELIGNAQRHDLQGLVGFGEVGCPAHTKHLDERLFGAVPAVLRASLALGEPDGAAAGGDAFPDIGRQGCEGVVELAAGDAALDLHHAVRSDQVFDEGIAEEIVADADLGRRQVALHEHFLRDSRVQNDVSVVREIEVAALGQILRAGEGKGRCRRCEDAADGRVHDLVLEVVHARDPVQDVAEGRFRQLGEEIAGNLCRHGMGRHTPERGDGFGIVVGADVVKCRVHSGIIEGRRAPAGSCRRS